MRAELRAELRGAHVAASSSNISTILAKFEPITVIGIALFDMHFTDIDVMGIAAFSRKLNAENIKIRKSAKEAKKEKNKLASVRDILELCKPDWAYFCVAFVGLSLAAAGESFIPLFFGKLIDAVSIERDDEFVHVAHDLRRSRSTQRIPEFRQSRGEEIVHEFILRHPKRG